ncbi:MAG: nickel-responsive transcriptional regulator NikR [Candidatus Thermoplasmatota archaeon]|nr:nickel-responsive transcriptional regulator NikR [Candidatus Thermoplasmatota archaeon]
MPSRVVRLGVSLEPELLQALDRWINSRNSASRSEALRSLIRKELSDTVLGDPSADAVATVMILYRHTAYGVQRRLTSAQHRWGEHIRSATHFHLQGDACLEVLVLAGKHSELVRAAEDLRGVKGVLHGDYMLSTPKVAGGKTGHRHPHAPH